MMGGQGMMGGGQGTMMGGPGMMGSGMMDGGQGMMGGHGMMGGSGMMGSGMMDGGQGMMGGGMMDMMGMGDQCPMFVAGTTVQAKDTSDGMAMTFTTTGNVAELRRRIHVMADHMNAHSSGAGGGMGMHGMGMGADAGMGMGGSMMGGGMMGGGTMPAMHAQVEDVDHGARLKMTPADPAKLNEMRQHMKEHVQMMNQSHGCSMMADAGR
jgi:hypothetical protein